MATAPDIVGPTSTRSTAPAYGFPPLFMSAWFATLPLGRPRNLGREAERLFSGRVPAPLALGTGHIPPAGTPFVLAMNHYERPGLNVWWAAMWVSVVLWRARGEQPPVRWLIADQIHGYRVGPLRIPDPAMRWMVGRVARRYGALRVPRDSGSGIGRARSLRRAGSALRGAGGRPVGVTPEAGRGGVRVLVTPEPNAGMAIAWLARHGAPVLPVGVFETLAPGGDADPGGPAALTARFGPPLSLRWGDSGADRGDRERLGETVMRAIATQLPEELRGPYGEPPAGGDGAGR